MLGRRRHLDHFGQRRDARRHLQRTGKTQRLHALARRQIAHAGQIDLAGHQLAQLGRHQQDFVKPDAPHVTGHAALDAPHGAIHARRPGRLPGAHQVIPDRLFLRRHRVGLLAVGAQDAHQALGHDAQQGGIEQVGRRTQVEQAGDGRRRIVGVQRGQHQVTGECRLDRHLGGFEIADLADHDDVRVLPHQCPHAFGKAQVNGLMNLHLVEGRLDHLDRVFDGAHIHLGRGQLLERRIQRRGLAGAGRAGHEDDAVGLGRDGFPARLVLLRKTQLDHVAHQHLGVEDAHHQFFAKRRGQRG